MTSSTIPTSALNRLANAKLWLARYGLVIALLGLSAILALATRNFLTVANLITVVRQISINGILAVGVTYVLLTGGVDLSLGSLVALTGVTAACCAHPGEYPVLIPIFAGVLAGGYVGGAATTNISTSTIGWDPVSNTWAMLPNMVGERARMMHDGA